MAFRNPFAARLASSQAQINLTPSPDRNPFIQQMLARTLQNNGRGSKSAAESLDIASSPIIAALLNRWDAKQKAQQQMQQKALANQLVGGAMQTKIPLENLPNDQGQPQAPDVTSVPTEGPTGQTRSALAGILAQNPQAMAAMALQQAMPPPPKPAMTPYEQATLGISTQRLKDEENKPPTPETLHAVIDPNTGKSVLLPTSKAQGMEPASASVLASNAPLLPPDDPTVKSFKEQILGGNATLQNVPMNFRSSVASALSDTSKGQFSPMAASRFTLAASRITHPYTNMSAYKLTADGKPYLERIDAALKNPGSVSDQDLLDSLTKLNTGGNAVTDAQVRLITDGKSYADVANTFANKFKNGGVLSPDQRQQIQAIASQIYDNYKTGYQPIYEKAAAQLQAAGIPKQFWTIPDLNAINGPVELGGAASGSSKAMPDLSKMSDDELRKLIGQ